MSISIAIKKCSYHGTESKGESTSAVGAVGGRGSQGGKEGRGGGEGEKGSRGGGMEDLLLIQYLLNSIHTCMQILRHGVVCPRGKSGILGVSAAWQMPGQMLTNMKDVDSTLWRRRKGDFHF